MEIGLRILKGIIMGLMVSIPLGPVGIIIIRRSLNRGWVSGFVSGLGAASADLIYAIFAATGFSIVLRLAETHIQTLQIITFGIIIIIGYAISQKSIKKLKNERSKSSNLFSDFFSIFLLTFSNPLVIGVFLAFFTGTANVEDKAIENIILTLIGVFLGALLWWLSLTVSVSFFRHKFRFRNIFWINKITGIVILIIGIVGLLYVLLEPWLV